MKKGNKISAILITKNEEEKINRCLKSVVWADEIIVVDTGSTDKTIEKAKRFTSKVYSQKGGSYSDWRNFGLSKSSCEWVFYIDSDEECPNSLKEEILSSAKDSSGCSLYVIPRRNIILGKELKYGGWWPDYVKRIFKRTDLDGWKGDLHEEPVFSGKMGYLKQPLIHYKHDNLLEMLVKTNKWSEVEAKLMFDSNHPPMNIPRFITAMTRELWKRMVSEKGFMDGSVGVIYSIYQMYSKFISYAKLWEMQQKKLEL